MTGAGSSLWNRWERFTRSAVAMTEAELCAVATAKDRTAESSFDAETVRLACAEHNLAMAAAAWRRIYDEVQL